MRQKTSQAKHYAARLNPIHELEKRVMDVIEYWEKQGVNFKQLIVDRIGRVDLHLTPEIYARETGNENRAIELLLERYTEHLLTELEKRGVKTGDISSSDENEDENNSPFSRKIAQGFMARQRQTLGDDES